VGENNRNLILAIVLSLMVFLGWDYFVMRPQVAKQKAIAEAQAKLRKPEAAIQSGTTPVASTATQVQSRDAVIAATNARVKISSSTLHGSINLKGGRIDDLTMIKFRETIAKNSPAIVLLSPSGTAQPYFMQAGWLGQNIIVPDASSVWSADGASLTPATPVTLRWNNGAGLVFVQTIALDDRYLFTVRQSVINQSNAGVAVTPYGLISRNRPEKSASGYVLHEGPIGAFGALKEISYKDLDEDAPVQRFDGIGGWFGFTDKYWLTAMIPEQTVAVKASVQNIDKIKKGVRFQSDMQLPGQVIAAGASATSVLRFFAGAKEVAIINGYEKQLGVKLFDRAIDWGWFWFLTKPFFAVLHWLYTLFGNFGLAIIGLTVIVKASMFPIAYKGSQSMSRMKYIQPKIKELQERYKDDKAAQQKAQIELFQKEKINPVGGCLPMLLQIPVFYALYKVLFVSLEMRHQPFVLWIKDLSAPDPLTPVNLFGLLPFAPPTMLAVGVLPILYAITFHFQMKLQPQTGLAPEQQQIFKFMPWVFMFMFSSFSAGLVLYWIVSNTLSIVQQWWLNKLEARRHANQQAVKA
jgi:YidC/Oxa1 family membrane protein insertase